MTPLHVQLRARRESLGWSKSHLARLLSVRHSLVADWELGRVQPGLSRAESWASTLGFDLVLTPVVAVFPAPPPPFQRVIVSADERLLLEVLRKARDLSLAQMGRLLGVSACTVRRYEAGARNPRADRYDRWRSLLGAETEDVA